MTIVVVVVTVGVDVDRAKVTFRVIGSRVRDEAVVLNENRGSSGGSKSTGCRLGSWLRRRSEKRLRGCEREGVCRVLLSIR